MMITVPADVTALLVLAGGVAEPSHTTMLDVLTDVIVDNLWAFASHCPANPYPYGFLLMDPRGGKRPHYTRAT